MNKIKLSANQYNKLIKLEAALPVSNPQQIQETAGENIRAAINLCKALALEINDLENFLNDTLYALVKKNIDFSVATMTEYTHIAKTVKEDAKAIANYLAGSISKFIEVAETEESFTVIASREEIQSVIDKNFEIYPVMSLGYNEGSYALLFGEDDETIEIKPFIFAKGRKEDYEQVQRFIETFLDLENPYE